MAERRMSTLSKYDVDTNNDGVPDWLDRRGEKPIATTESIETAPAKAARISRGVHERVRTLAATNRNRARARRQNAADPKDDEH
jgi:hypothetical protein